LFETGHDQIIYFDFDPRSFLENLLNYKIPSNMKNGNFRMMITKLGINIEKIVV